MKLERAGRRKRELKNLVKRDSVWYFRKESGGRQIWRSLETGDVELAKQRRNELVRRTQSSKWEEPARKFALIGEIITRFKAATDLQLLPKTVKDYIWSFRRVVRLAAGGRVDPDSQSSSVLTRDLVRAWQRLGIGPDPDRLKADSSAVSSNATLSQARGVFSRRAMLGRAIYADLVLPDLEGFLRAPLLKVLKRDFYEKPPDAVLRRTWVASQRLIEPMHGPTRRKDEAIRRGLWIIFRLALQAGLRRSEIMGMRWRWFQGRPEDRIIRTYFEKDFIPKGKRERPIPVMPAMEMELRAVAESLGWPTGPDDRVLPGTKYWHDRMIRTFGKWLDALGWPRRQKAHELRKIFASDLTEIADPYDTQQALGHQHMKTTSLYAARRRIKPVDQAARYGAEIRVLPAA